MANDRDGVLDLLTVTMKELSISVRRNARMIITGTCDEAVKAGKIREHRLADIELADNGTKHDRTDFVFPAHAQVKFVADGDENTLGAGICVWLMRGCGLRIEEALAVEKKDFRDNGTILRVYQQATRDGRETAPLKKRKRGEYRDIPVPTWLWDMVKDLPDGPLMPGNGDRRYQLYGTVYDRFMNAAGKARIPAGFTPHSLRHAFASAMLSKGVPITDVAHWLGHRDVRVTYRIYGHLVPRQRPALSRSLTRNTRMEQAKSQRLAGKVTIARSTPSLYRSVITVSFLSTPSFFRILLSDSIQRTLILGLAFAAAIPSGSIARRSHQV